MVNRRDYSSYHELTLWVIFMKQADENDLKKTLQWMDYGTDVFSSGRNEHGNVRAYFCIATVHITTQ